MKIRTFVIFLLMAGTGCGLALAGSFSEDFQNANGLYRAGKFSEAIVLYEKLADHYPAQGEIYFNLGNACFRSGKMGASILAYEQAKFLNPRDRDTRHNLAHVRGLLEYRIKDKRNWYIQFGEKLLGYFTVNEVLLGFLFLYGLFMASWILTLFFRRGLEWGWIIQSLLSMAIFSGALYGAKHIQTHVIREAIVTVKDAEIHYGPSDSDLVALRLGEGLKVYVIDHRDSWSRVWLTNGEGGWMANNQISGVRPKMK
ncbi:MAG: tetratricopeptide repeat protein [Candidatus Omnitrophica bacterium]|nr:tetratricopeptide repeat protein [Candidatus Omnitrophota bacterium]